MKAIEHIQKGHGERSVRVLHSARKSPSNEIGNCPGTYYASDRNQSDDHADAILIVHPPDDVIHVPNKSSGDNQTDVHDEEAEITDQQEKMQRPGCLASAKQFRIPGETVVRAATWRCRSASKAEP